jgi:hypothetical protein
VGVEENRLVIELEKCINEVIDELLQHGVGEEHLPCSLALAYIWYCPQRVLHANPNAPEDQVSKMWEHTRAKTDEMLLKCKSSPPPPLHEGLEEW